MENTTFDPDTLKQASEVPQDAEYVDEAAPAIILDDEDNFVGVEAQEGTNE